jgi:hypothetical protein
MGLIMSLTSFLISSFFKKSIHLSRMLEKVNVSFMIITLCCYSMIIIITHNSDKGENEAKRSFRPTFLNEVEESR